MVNKNSNQITSRVCKFPRCGFEQFGSSSKDQALLIQRMQEHEKEVHNLDPSKSAEEKLWDKIMEKHPIFGKDEVI